ncbi:MAG: cysteine--tRNA ligase [bacterium]|nr:cysteine--tRNA ligase [bacterium]
MIRLYDTIDREVVELRLRKPGEVSIYVCGPTVYDVPHLGHARTALTYDVLCRYLRWRGLRVRMVSNITDVDDKIIARAAAEGSTEEQVAARFTDVYIRETAALGVAEPDERPRATEYIIEMVEFVDELVQKGAAYVIDGAGVYFDVDRYPDYGRLPHRRPDELRDSAGARVAIDERKRDPLDFALWKAAKPGEPTWEAPWMPGRPGWHIECVAMSLRLLGDGFDIHGGGSDLIFPHHENERAEAEAAGRRFARLWMHSAMVNVGGEKMAKSAGNFRTLADVLALHDPRALRLAMLQAHYRSTTEIDEAVLAGAAAGIGRLDAFARRVDALGDLPAPDQVSTATARADFIEAMDGDLGTPAAVAVIFDLLRQGNVCLDAGDAAGAAAALATVRELCDAVGLGVGSQTRARAAGEDGDDSGSVDQLIEQREAARAARDYATADRIRAKLADEGIELEDTPGGTIWRRVR